MIPLLLLVTAGSLMAGQPFLESSLLFPPEKVHNHSSAIVELPNGDLFTVWYRGSGERTADDVAIYCARKPKGSKQWLERQVIADTPGFPDCNPTVFVDSKKRLWLLWPVILANEWHTALMKYKIASDYGKGRELPKWEVSEDMLFVPRNFAAKSLEAIEANRGWFKPGLANQLVERAKDKYFSRLGWMTRAHPVELTGGRILVPLYSDGYDFSLMAITDDFGKTWSTSEPLVSNGGIQPAIARKKDGTLVAYMRDNGPPPKRLHVSESKDNGVTWSAVRDSEIPNPGSGAEVITLRDGRWVLIYNDTEKGRHSLAVAMSDDEGASWKWKRHLELKQGSSFHYPTIVQGKDGSLHASYSHFTPEGKSIKHAHFNTEWIEQGDARN
ncbi:MAG: sialidase family protein [Bryobacteraceae bacterium]